MRWRWFDAVDAVQRAVAIRFLSRRIIGAPLHGGPVKSDKSVELSFPTKKLRQLKHGCVAVALNEAIARQAIEAVKVEWTRRAHRAPPNCCALSDALTINEQPWSAGTNLRDQRCKWHDSKTGPPAPKREIKLWRFENEIGIQHRGQRGSTAGAYTHDNQQVALWKVALQEAEEARW